MKTNVRKLMQFLLEIWFMKEIYVSYVYWICRRKYHISTSWLEDATGSWSLSYHFVGILSTIVVSLWLLERPISYVRCGYVKPVINTIDEFTVNSEMGVNGSNLEMPVPSQGHYGFHSFPVVDWFCLFIYLWVLTFPL